jgi:enoyl-[acyl-carrier-protein] reductase (NADH)
VQKALPLLNDGSSIILTGSVAGVKGTPAFGVYGATKAAIRNFVRAWTVELKDRYSAGDAATGGRYRADCVHHPDGAYGRTR